MIIHNVIQGSQAWHDLRFNCLSASEAPVMMGASSKMSRNELLALKANGSEKEYSDFVIKKILNKGHEYEALARPIAEELLGEELYPTVATEKYNGIERDLLASYDGLTMLQTVNFEHKSYNEKLADQVRRKELEPEYYWQLEQQLLVSGADYVLFAVSNGTKESFVSMEYYPVKGRKEQLLAGWQQFEIDLANYQPQEKQPEAVGRSPENLPALRIEVTGAVTESNLIQFKEHALNVIGSINRNLVTDQDFADAEKAVKWCKTVEERLEAAKHHALSQTESINVLFNTIDEISDEAKATHLELDKLIKSMKENRKLQIRQAAESALANHIETLNRGFMADLMPAVKADFALAIKGKRSIDSIQNAVDTELANTKIKANEIAEVIRSNLNLLNKSASNYSFLFKDIQSIVLKSKDDFALLVKSRIAEYEASQAEKTKQQPKEQEVIAEVKQEAEPVVIEQLKLEEKQTCSIPKDLLSLIVDNVFDGAIEDIQPIEEIHNIILNYYQFNK